MNAPVRSRVGLRVGDRTLDVAIPSGVPLYEVLREVGVDLDDPNVAIVDSAGRRVELYSTTGDELVDGAVLSVVTSVRAAPAGRARKTRTDPATVRPASSPWWLGLAGVAAVVLAVTVGLDVVSGGTTSRPQERAGLAAVVALASLALALVRARPGASSAWPTVVAVLGGAAAGAVTIDPGLPGAGRLMVVAGLVGALVPTAVRWAVGRRNRDESADLAAVLLVVLAVAAATAAVALLMGLPATFPAAVLLGAVPLGLRALPTMCIDVPDDQLIDVTLVARTVSTVRAPASEPLGAVNERMVTWTVRSAERRRDAGTIVLSLAAPVLAAVVLLGAGAGALTRWGSIGACVLVALVLGLAPRSQRGVLVHWAPRVGAVALLIELAALGGLAGGGTVALMTALLVAVGLGVAALSLPIGRGWRSVGLSRLADAAEGLATVLALPVALLGAGAVEAFRLMTSG